MAQRSPLPPLPVLIVIGFGVIFFLVQLVLGPVEPEEPLEPAPSGAPSAAAPSTPPELVAAPDPAREEIAVPASAPQVPAAAEPEQDPAPLLHDLVVHLTDLDPAHAEGHLMLQVVRDLDDEHLAWAKGLTPLGQPVVLERLPAEELTLLLLHHEDWSANRDPVAALPVDLRTGTTAVELVVPTLYDLEVHAPGLDAGATLSLDRTAGLGWHSFGKHLAKVDAEGRARFVGLPADAYTLHHAGVQLELELPCGVVTFGE